MFGLGNDLVIELPGVSWLICLHLVVMFFLFLLLLSYLGIHVFQAIEDRPGSTSSANFSSNDNPGTKQIQKNPSNSSSNCSRINNKTEDLETILARNKDLETIKGQLTTSTRRTKVKVGKEQYEEEEIEEMGESLPMMLKQRSVMQFSNPCYYLGQALKPFLKCLGIQSIYQDPSAVKQGKTLKKMTEENPLDQGENVDPKGLQ
ncbi:uncharacterized protein LOC122072063 [Macadamia integrifolia]|uniref:uncharacterized protein LOC122072063 n=1 Tax=Macadamia integrifolia TaxID=60698 RepID=UPI001C4F8593|nr:uncharacterized protein LOC122072063 [Macadamia integrifolia]